MRLHAKMQQRYPMLSVRTARNGGGATEEHFTITSAHPAIRLHAGSKRAEEYGLSFLLACLEGERWAWAPGHHSPLFHIRALWVAAEARFCLPSRLTLFLPHWLGMHHDGGVDAIAWTHARLVDMGVNTVIVAPGVYSQTADLPEHPITWKALRTNLDALHASGIKIALFASSPDIGDLFSQLAVLRDSVDYLFWPEGALWKMGREPEKKYPTAFEKACEEVHFLEKKCRQPLIYYVPESEKQASWLYPLSCEVSARSVVAFEAETNHAVEDWARVSTLFTYLAGTDVGASRLMPCVTIDQMPLASGVLSDLPFELIDGIASHQVRNCFCGMGIAVATLTDAGTPSDAILWTAGQRLWRPMPMYGLLELWLDRYHKGWKKIWAQGLARKLRAVFSARRHLLHGHHEGEAKVKQKVFEAVRALSDLRAFLEEQGHGKIGKLAGLLFEFQEQMKLELEETCRQFGLVIPSALQDFRPLA